MPSQNKKLDVFLNNLRLNFELINSSYDAVDSKANYLIGFEIALFIAFYSIPNDFGNSIKYYEFILATFFLVFSLILLIIVIWPKEYKTSSVGLKKIKAYLKLDEKEYLKQIIVDLDMAIEVNKKKLFTKTKFYKFAIVFLLLAIIIYLLSKSGRFYV
jgi:hypothetical protein